MKEHVLYGSRGSGSASVEAGLRACGLPYRVVTASNWEPESAVEELAKINPLRQIPTLVLPDGTVMSESAAILIHLGLAHPGSGLLPQDASERARMLRGLVYIPANCYAAITVIDYPERFTTSENDEARDQVRQAGRKYLHRNWEVFADMFPARPFLSGEQPGALDFLAAVVSRWSGTRAHVEKTRPDFFAALKRIEAHPLVAGVFREHWET
jgi:GST-like protein